MKKELRLDGTNGLKERLFTLMFAIVACCLACGLYYHYVVETAFVEISLQVNQPGYFKIYWAEPGAQYAEEKMVVAQVIPGLEEYRFLLTDIAKIDRLRIDTHNYKGTATLKRLFISQPGWKPIHLEGGSSFTDLTPLAQVKSSRLETKGMVVESTGNDPNFEFRPELGREKLDIAWLAIRLLLVAALVIPPVRYSRKLVKHYRFIPLMLFGVFLLIIIMASTSKRNVHPDEYVHLNAADYYKSHWMPPQVEDPEIRHTYSIYGFSRLNNGEIYYLFAGRFDKFLDGLHLQEPLGLRMFNVFLFGLIVWHTICHIPSRLVALPLLISPQVWYVFSYCNSDAFSLFVTFLVASQLVDQHSLLHRYLIGENRWIKIKGLLLIGCLIGLCLLLKKNYLVFTGFFFFCLVVKLFFQPGFCGERRDAVRRVVLVLLVSLGVLWQQTWLDHQVNGPDKGKKMLEMRELLAKPEYKPSTPLEEKHIYLNMRDRGVKLKYMVTVGRWFQKVFHSAFGVYGYLTISGSSIYYDLVRWTGVALFAYLFVSLFLWGGWLGRGVGICALGASTALIGASVYHCWVVDFQPQGRYLFPILPILGILCGWFVYCFRQRIMFIGCITMYIMGLYSFIFDALTKIPRIGW